jgi:hypothetical protein
MSNNGENSRKFCFLIDKSPMHSQIIVKKREGFGKVWCDFNVGLGSHKSPY